MAPTNKPSMNTSTAASNDTLWLVCGIGFIIIAIIISIIAVIVIVKFICLKRKREEEITAKPPSKIKAESQQLSTVASAAPIKSNENPKVFRHQSRQPPPSIQQCSSSGGGAAAGDEKEKKGLSDEKTKKKKSLKEEVAVQKKKMVSKKDLKPVKIQEPCAKKKGDVVVDDDDDEAEEPIDVKKLDEVEKAAEKVNVKKGVGNILATREEESRKKREKFLIDKLEAREKVKKMFETSEWDPKHMPPKCDYQLFMASSSIIRLCIMEYLKAHADKILISNGYKICNEQAQAPPAAFEWLRSPEITEDDSFLKARAWMLENWSNFKRSPVSEWGTYYDMEIPFLYMAAMKDCITEPADLDQILKHIMRKSAEYFNAIPEKDWQLTDHPMKVLAKIFEEGKTLEIVTQNNKSVNTTENDS